MDTSKNPRPPNPRPPNVDKPHMRGRFRVLGKAKPSTVSHPSSVESCAVMGPSHRGHIANNPALKTTKQAPSTTNNPDLNKQRLPGASMPPGARPPGILGPEELVKRGTSMMLGAGGHGSLSPGVLRLLAEESRSSCGIIVERRTNTRKSAIRQNGKSIYGYSADAWSSPTSDREHTDSNTLQ